MPQVISSTEYNERLLEHYGWVAYASLRFGRPEMGIEGWQTDQGKIYVHLSSDVDGLFKLQINVNDLNSRQAATKIVDLTIVK